MCRCDYIREATDGNDWNEISKALDECLNCNKYDSCYSVAEANDRLVELEGGKQE